MVSRQNHKATRGQNEKSYMLRTVCRCFERVMEPLFYWSQSWLNLTLLSKSSEVWIISCGALKPLSLSEIILTSIGLVCGKKITSMQNNGMQLLINELTSMGVGAGVVIKPSLKLGEAWVIYIPSFYVEVITYLWNDINDISDMDPPREINYTVLKSVSRRKLRDPPPRGTAWWIT